MRKTLTGPFLNVALLSLLLTIAHMWLLLQQGLLQGSSLTRKQTLSPPAISRSPSSPRGCRRFALRLLVTGPRSTHGWNQQIPTCQNPSLRFPGKIKLSWSCATVFQPTLHKQMSSSMQMCDAGDSLGSCFAAGSPTLPRKDVPAALAPVHRRMSIMQTMGPFRSEILTCPITGSYGSPLKEL